MENPHIVDTSMINPNFVSPPARNTPTTIVVLNACATVKYDITKNMKLKHFFAGPVSARFALASGAEIRINTPPRTPRIKLNHTKRFPYAFASSIFPSPIVLPR